MRARRDWPAWAQSCTARSAYVRVRTRNKAALTIVIGMTRLSSIRLLIAGLTVLALAAVFRIPGASSNVVQFRHVDGGQDYYSQFSNSLPSDPSYFPIGVWC